MSPSPSSPATRERAGTSRRSLIFDGALAALCLIAELGSLLIAKAAGEAIAPWVEALTWVLVPGQAVVLLLRRRRPLITAIVTLPAGLLLSPNGIPSMGLFQLIAMYSCAAYLPGTRAWLVSGGTALVYGGLALARQFDGSAVSVWQSLTVAVPVVLMTVVGQLVRLRRELWARRQAEGEREAVRGERRRIARELHDVVAHHITVMNVLIGGARATMDQDPAGAKEALVTAERTARQAMAEMRHLLDVLRADDSPDGPYVGAGQLPELVERAGLPVDLEITGGPRDLPAPVDLAVYRLVQEALTNIRKHAGEHARGRVRVAFEPDAVEVEVIDDGRGPVRAGHGHTSGHGLKGMAERVALCNGLFESGPLPQGGFRVHARIPVKEGRA